MIRLARIWCGLSVLTMSLGAQGAGDASTSGFLLAEIVLPQQSERSSGHSSKSATDQRGRARAYQNESPSPTVVIVPEEDGGMFTPRTGSWEGRSSDNRMRARSYQQEDSRIGSNLSRPADSNEQENTADKASENRARARAFSLSNSNNSAIVRYAQDGTPLVSCADVNNSAGRIGDDLIPGATVYIVKGNKQIKARCE